MNGEVVAVMKRTYAQNVEYETPASLDVLAGPSRGVIRLPRTLYWGPEVTTDLTDRNDVQRTYQAVVRIGTAEEQTRWLDRDLLLSIWGDLVLPARCVSAWQSRFPELADRSRHPDG